MNRIRRFLALLAACMLLLCALPALAEVPDLDPLTNDELVTLLTRLNEELVTRGISKTAALPGGRYIGGSDLPCGRYIFTSMATGRDWGNVTVYTDEGEGTMLLWEVVPILKDGEAPKAFFINLNEGDELILFSNQIDPSKEKW